MRKKFNHKIITVLATLLIFGQSVVPTATVVAETMKATVVTTLSEAEESSKESQPETKTSGDDATEEPVTAGSDTSEQPLEKETSKANDSPTVEDDAVSTFLKDNELMLSTDGEFMTAGDSNYSTYDTSSFGNLFPNRLRGNFVVDVPSWTNIANIDIRFNNGLREYGWYGKRMSGNVAYCTQPGVAVNVGANGGYDQSKISNANIIKSSLVNYYGYEKGGKTLANELKVQLLNWEIVNKITPTSISGIFSLGDYQAWRKGILSQVDKFYQTVSFANQVVKLKVGETKTLTDTKGAFSNYEDGPLVNNANVTIAKSGNKVSVTAKKDSKDGNVRFKYKIDKYYQAPSMYYTHPYTQNVVTLGLNDPKYFDFKVEVEKKGNALIKKVDKDTGKALANAKFKLSYNGKNEEKVSNAKGEVALNDLEGGTVVTVEEIKAPTGYVLNKTPQKVTIVAGQTKTLTFTNKKISGSVKLIKYGDQAIGTGEVNPLLKGAEFTLFNSSNKEMAKATTNDKGEVVFNALLYGNYVLKETKTPIGYHPIADIPVTISEDGKVYEIKATDKIKLVEVELSKEDAETKELLANATFKYEYLTKKLEGTTDAQGKLVLKDIPHGSVLTITEIKAPTGYVLNSNPVTITVDSTKVNKVTMTNKKIRGNIQLVKRADQNWNTGKVADFLKDAEFTLYNAAGKAVDKATTNAKGEVTFSNHIYGEYVVKETVVPEGYLAVADMNVSITENNKTYELAATDKVIRENMKFIKIADDSGHSILSEDAEFEFKNLQTNEVLKQKDPLTGKETTVFVADKNGEVAIPNLMYGYYEVRETKAPDGYLILTKPVKFFVDGTHNGLITVKMGNKLAKGQVTMTKFGQKGTKVDTLETKFGDLFTVQYEDRPLEGATFELHAGKQIVTGDGVVRYEKDALVGTYTTNTDGNFTSTPDYLGSYYAVEVAAPAGFIVDPTPIPYDLNYEGETVPLTSTSIEAKNKWNEYQLKINKEDEVLTGWENNEIQLETKPSQAKVFGLFRASDYVFEEELLVPEGSLMAVMKTIKGVAMVQGQYPEGEYLVKELDAGLNHVIDDKEYPVTIIPGDNRDVIQVNVFESGAVIGKGNMSRKVQTPILNKLYRTDVSFKKMNETATLKEKDGYTYAFDQLGEGAEFALKDESDTVIQELTIDKTGVGTWHDLVVGTFFMAETKPSHDALVLDDTTYRIEVSQQAVKIFNDETDELVVEKTVEVLPTEESPEEVIEGEEVGEKTPRSTEESAKRDKETETEEETDTEEETETPEEDAAMLTLTNKYKRGKVVINKTDFSDGKKLPDAGFEISDKDGKVVRSGRTDKEGNMEVAELPVGSYTFREFDAPKGYLIDETPVPFEIKEDGEIVRCEMTNVKIKDTLTQTPNKTTPTLLIGYASVIIGLLLIGLYVAKSMKKNNENG